MANEQVKRCSTSLVIREMHIKTTIRFHFTPTRTAYWRQKSFFLIFYFIYFCLHWVFVAARGLSLAAASRGYSSLQCTCFSLRWLLLLQSTGSRHAGFSSCGTWAQQLWLMGSRAQAQQLWATGLVAPWRVGSSRIRARTRVPCIGRRSLNHCATREVPGDKSLKSSVWPYGMNTLRHIAPVCPTAVGTCH